MNLRRRSVLFLAVVIGLIAASAVVVAIKPVVLGLDLQGGVEVVLQGKPTRDSQVTPEAIARSVEVIRNRVDSFGVSEPEIQTQGSDQIVVSLPGAKNPDQVVEDLIKPAQLVFTDYEANFVASDPSLWKMVQKAQGTTPKPPIEGSASYYLFKTNATHRLLAGPDVDRASLLQPYGGKVPPKSEMEKVPAGLVIYSDQQKLDPSKADSPSRTVYVLMQDKPGLSGSDITSASQSFDNSGGGGSQEPIVTMAFTDAGAQKFQDVTRDLAQRFNTIYGDTLHLPEAYVLDDSAKVPGRDGEKMSKSYDNIIPIFETPKKLGKMIMSIKTDSTSKESSKNPDTCSVFELYKLFATPEAQMTLTGRYRAGGMGYGEAKQALYEAAIAHFETAFARRTQLETSPDIVEDILREGAHRARAKAQEVLERVRAACGLLAKPV